MTLVGNNMPLWNKIFIISLVLVLILTGVYCYTIVPKQIDFMNKCESDCNNKNMTYETTFFSYPNNINGKCYCITKQLQELNQGEKQ